MIYSMYPEQNISAWIVSGRNGIGCSAAVGYSILNRTSDIDVGRLMLKYHGGGHKAVGTCQFSDAPTWRPSSRKCCRSCARWQTGNA